MILKYFRPHYSTHQSERQQILGEKKWTTWSRYGTDNVTLADVHITKINRMTYSTLLWNKNDATACFDRIPNNLTTFVAKHLMSQKKYAHYTLLLFPHFNMKFSLREASQQISKKTRNIKTICNNTRISLGIIAGYI